MSAGQWILVIVIALALVLLIWWWLHRERPENGLLKADVQFAQPAPEPAAPPEPDDLSRIEGIGPKISAVLGAAGITTFAELAACEPAQLKQIITAGGVRLGDPATWPAQAALAAQGRWDDLAALQTDLHGGRNR